MEYQVIGGAYSDTAISSRLCRPTATTMDVLSTTHPSYNSLLTATMTTITAVSVNDTVPPAKDFHDPLQFDKDNTPSLQNFVTLVEYHAPYAILVNKYFTPLCYVVGMVGNVVSALFWSSQRIRACNTAAVYLTALAVADFSFLALHVFYELENPWLVPTLGMSGWCQLWNMLYMASSYLCVFLVCAFTVERFLSICHPFRSERFGRTRSPRIILLLLVLSLALGSPQAYFWNVKPGSGECHVPRDWLYETSFYSVWNWCSEMVVFGALPVLVLALNVCVLRKIRKAGQLQLSDVHSSGSSSRKTKRRSFCSSTFDRMPGSANAAGQALGNGTTNVSFTTGGSHNFTSTTVTLLWISFYLIFTTLPVTILFAIQTTIPIGDPMPLANMADDPVWQRYLTYYASRVIIKEIGMTHHVGNVFIYLATSRRFRRQVRKRFLRSAASTIDTTEVTDAHNPGLSLKVLN